MKFICYYYFVDWRAISLGISLWLPFNIEIHLPFGFMRIGWEEESEGDEINYNYCNNRTWGIK